MTADRTATTSGQRAQGRDAEGRDVFIDAALFLGMHSEDEQLRVACKAFFVERLDKRVLMSLEEVGRCDDVIWAHPRELQDLYYPFMDHLHTVMDISRRPYEPADVRLARTGPPAPRGSFSDRLLLAMVMNRKGLLHTAGPRAAALRGLPVRAVPARPVGAPEPSFPEPLERLYRTSLALRLPQEGV